MREEMRYEFEGSLMTMVEIQKIVTALSRTSIRNHLAAGRNTRQQMLSRDSVARRSSSAQRGSVALKSLLRNAEIKK
jgi:hypothetical protein